jgi:hypothetical protein
MDKIGALNKLLRKIYEAEMREMTIEEHLVILRNLTEAIMVNDGNNSGGGPSPANYENITQETLNDRETRIHNNVPQYSWKMGDPANQI